MTTISANNSVLDTQDIKNESLYQPYREGEEGTDGYSIKQRIKPALTHIKPVSNDGSVKKQDIRQQWRGVVISCNNTQMTVRLTDETQPENPDEIVVLPRDAVDKGDQPLIRTGALFNWYIGYQQAPHKNREKFSIIRFRRLPKWTEPEIQRAQQQAEKYANYLLAD